MTHMHHGCSAKMLRGRCHVLLRPLALLVVVLLLTIASGVVAASVVDDGVVLGSSNEQEHLYTSSDIADTYQPYVHASHPSVEHARRTLRQIVDSTAEYDPVEEREALRDFYKGTKGEKWLDRTGWKWFDGDDDDDDGKTSEWPCDVKKHGKPTGLEPQFFANQANLQRIIISVAADYDIFESWMGVLCLAPNSTYHGNDNGGNGTVIAFSLSWNNLAGEMPDFLGRLPHLHLMLLQYNSLTGRLPPSFGSSTSLIATALSFNHIDHLWGGCVPTSKLIYLSVDHNRIERWPPGFETCKIASLSVNNNRLTHLTPGLPPSVACLFVNDNKIQSLLSLDEMLVLKNLVVFDFSHNTEIALPESPNTTTNSSGWWPELPLQYMIGRGCNLRFDLATSPYVFTNLRYLDLSHNHITGDLPHWLSLMIDIELIDLHNNHMSGVIQPNFFRPCHDNYNCPKSFGVLNTLDLSMNKFSGELPITMAWLGTLQILNLSRNTFSGEIEDLANGYVSSANQITQQFRIASLQTARMSSGSVLGDLISVDLSHNEFTGSLETLALARVLTLDLSFNFFTGTLPRESKMLRNLRWFDVSHNQLTGSIPKALYEASNLVHLDFSYNRLRGKLHSDVSQLSTIRHIDLSNNHFSGAVPQEMKELEDLNKFRIQGNRFNEYLPLSIGRLCDSQGPSKVNTKNNDFACISPVGYECGDACDLNYKFWIWCMTMVVTLCLVACSLCYLIVPWKYPKASHWLRERLGALFGDVPDTGYFDMEMEEMFNRRQGNHVSYGKPVQVRDLFRSKKKWSYAICGVAILEAFQSIVLCVSSLYMKYVLEFDLSSVVLWLLILQPCLLLPRAAIGFLSGYAYHKRLLMVYAVTVFPAIVITIFILLPGMIRTNAIPDVTHHVSLMILLGTQLISLLMCLRLYILHRRTDAMFESDTGGSHYSDGALRPQTGDRRNNHTGWYDAALQSVKNERWYIKTIDARIIRKVGSGGFGDVFLAEWCGTPVALKKMHGWYLQLNEDAMKEFLHEMRIMARLRHPNIVEFLGASMEPPDHIILTEYIPRGSLFDVLDDESLVIGWVLRVKMALDIARGMAYLHAQTPLPIIHRDLKSMNLLVTSLFAVKVADFGLARHADHSVTMTFAIGTPSWNAPEVLAHQKYTIQADVYSFGIIMWELLTGEKPHANISPFEVPVKVVNGYRPPVPDECPEPWRRLMESSWDTDPSIRPSFLDISTRLEDMLLDATTYEDRAQAFAAETAAAAAIAALGLGGTTTTAAAAAAAAATHYTTGTGLSTGGRRSTGGLYEAPSLREVGILTGGEQQHTGTTGVGVGGQQTPPRVSSSSSRPSSNDDHNHFYANDRSNYFSTPKRNKMSASPDVASSLVADATRYRSSPHRGRMADMTGRDRDSDPGSHSPSPSGSPAVSPPMSPSLVPSTSTSTSTSPSPSSGVWRKPQRKKRAGGSGFGVDRTAPLLGDDALANTP